MPRGDDGSSSRTIASRTNGVVLLRAGFKSTAHEYLSISCLLCTASVSVGGPYIKEEGAGQTPSTHARNTLRPAYLPGVPVGERARYTTSGRNVSRSRLSVMRRLISLSLEGLAGSVCFYLLNLPASYTDQSRLRTTYFCDISSLS